MVTVSVSIALVTSCRTTKVGESGLLDSATQSYTPEESYKKSEANLFNESLNRLDILMHGDTWNKMVTHRNQNGYACEDEAPYGHIKEITFTNGKTGESVKMNNAGIRVKGNTSCDEPVDLKGFKIKFNVTDTFIRNENDEEVWRIQNVYEEWGKRLEYPEQTIKTIKKQSLYGLKSIGLRRGGNDMTRLRDGLSSDVFEYAGELARNSRQPGGPVRGGAVYRGGLVHVRIHNGFGAMVEGVYGLVELIDDNLIESHFGEGAANHLFKIKEAKGTFLDADMPSDRGRLLRWYEPEIIDGDGYKSDKEYHVKMNLCRERKIKQSACDKLEAQRQKAEEVLRGFKAQLSQAMAITDINERRTKLSGFLDIDNILSYAVSANLTGHWDSMIGAMSNNDYLFNNKQTGKWGIIAWDLDNTFGAGSQSYPWMAAINEFGVNLKYRPIFQAVLGSFPEEYKKRVSEYLDGVYQFDRINERIARRRDLVAPGSMDDMYQMLFKFKNHRWGNAWCNLNRNDYRSKVRIRDGWPVIDQNGGRTEARCE